MKKSLASKMPWAAIEIPMGGAFEFSWNKPRRVGDVIDFAMNYNPWDKNSKPVLAKAKVTKIIRKGYYQAERIK